MHTHIRLAAALACFAATPSLAQTTTAVGTGISAAEANSASGAIAVNRGNGGNSTINVAAPPANTTATVNQNLSGTTTSNINSNVSGSTTSRIIMLHSSPA